MEQLNVQIKWFLSQKRDKNMSFAYFLPLSIILLKVVLHTIKQHILLHT